MTEILPFHKWKDEQIRAGKIFEKTWYYSEYGRYVLKMRNKQKVVDK